MSDGKEQQGQGQSLMGSLKATLKEMVPKNWPQIVAWLLMTVVGAIGARYGLPNVPQPAPLPVWMQPPDGWVDDDDAVKAVQATLPFRVFADTPAGKADDPLPDRVYLWDSYRRLFGHRPPSCNQGPVGTCVSFGTARAIERTLATQIVASGGGKDEWKPLVEEVIYGGSRVEIGKGRIKGDGSVGAWAAQFTREYGVLDRGVHGAYDLTVYSPERARDWGRKGVPDDLEPKAKEHPVKDTTLVKTWAEAKKALASGYGIAVCSSQGFTKARDANGIARPSGSWAHCMALDGYHVEGGQEYGHIENSWGADYFSGPVGWGDPPASGFWADSATIGRMLAQGDSWAFSSVKGFPARKLDWFVRDRPRLPAEPRATLQIPPRWQLRRAA